MFSRLEQIALRELIEGREKMLARVDALEAEVAELKQTQIINVITPGDPVKERKRARG